MKRNLKSDNQSIVLVGGCFDILHPGHIIFLEKAKAAGDSLVVLLESDQKVRELKGQGRPIHTQKERAILLQALRSVDKVVMLPYLNNEDAYDQVIQKIKPSIIAIAFGHNNVYYHRRSAKKVGAKLKYVTKMIGHYSTSKILSYNHNK